MSSSVRGCTEVELADAKQRLEAATTTRLTARVIRAAVAREILLPLFADPADYDDNFGRVMVNFQTTARGLVKRGESLGATAHDVLLFKKDAEEGVLLPEDSCLAVFESQLSWRPFVDVTLCVRVRTRARPPRNARTRTTTRRILQGHAQHLRSAPWRWQNARSRPPLPSSRSFDGDGCRHRRR